MIPNQVVTSFFGPRLILRLAAGILAGAAGTQARAMWLERMIRHGQ